MNRFSPRLETLDGRDVPSATAPDVLATGPAAPHAGHALPTESVSFNTTGGASGGVLGGVSGGVLIDSAQPLAFDSDGISVDGGNDVGLLKASPKLFLTHIGEEIPQ
jgi:hypothetical protein